MGRFYVIVTPCQAIVQGSQQGTKTMKQYGTILDAIIAIAVFACIGVLLALGV